MKSRHKRLSLVVPLSEKCKQGAEFGGLRVGRPSPFFARPIRGPAARSRCSFPHQRVNQ